jgi:uncharacterized protein YqgC (DUF456 family)
MFIFVEVNALFFIPDNMDIALSVLAFLFSIVGIIGCIVPALPGVVLSYAGLLCAYFTSYSHMSASAIWIWLAITVAARELSALRGEVASDAVADYFLPAWMTRRFGGSRAGAIGATVGVFAGFFIFPPIGIILGPFVGAVAGELLNDRGDFPKAILVGFGSFLSFVVGTGLKVVAAVGMLIHVTADTYPAVRDWFATLF